MTWERRVRWNGARDLREKSTESNGAKILLGPPFTEKFLETTRKQITEWLDRLISLAESFTGPETWKVIPIDAGAIERGSHSDWSEIIDKTDNEGVPEYPSVLSQTKRFSDLLNELADELEEWNIGMEQVAVRCREVIEDKVVPWKVRTFPPNTTR